MAEKQKRRKKSRFWQSPINEAIERVRKIHDDEGWDIVVREHAKNLLAELEGVAKSYRELEAYARKPHIGRHSNMAARRKSELVHIQRYELVERLKAEKRAQGIRRYSEEALIQAAKELEKKYETVRRSWKIAKKRLRSPAYR